MGLAAEKWGEVVRETGGASGEMGETPRELGEMVGETGGVLRNMGGTVRETGGTLGEMGEALREMGEVVGKMGGTLCNWGRRPENRCAAVSRRVWGIKIPRSGCEPFARWLAIKLPTDPRVRMECGMTF